MTTRIYHGLPTEPLDQPAYLTIGNFDGVHCGHQALIEAMLASAQSAGCLAGVLCFDPHPLAVLRPDIPLAYLTTLDQRIELLKAHGLDFVVILPFSRETAATSAPDFMHSLVRSLRVRSLWVGPDFALGRGREGTPERLRDIGRELGYTVQDVTLYEAADGAVHSSYIRSLLAKEGDVSRAAALLGRPFQVSGVVKHGARRGRELGYPTANLTLPPDQLVPAFGIYACWAWIGDTGRKAAASIGVRPTFDNGAPSIEAYVLDFAGELYGQNLGLSFIKRLRPEQKFPNAAALVDQMALDVADVRRTLSAPPDDAASEETDAIGPDDRPGAAPPPCWQELEHTADWVIRVEAGTLPRLFACAARAMFDLQDADRSAPVTVARSIKVAADNQDELLVAWLSQLLLDQDTSGQMYTRFQIHDMSPCSLLGTAFGYEGTPAHTAVKAVTYHRLSIDQTAHGWQAIITFDV